MNDYEEKMINIRSKYMAYKETRDKKNKNKSSKKLRFNDSVNEFSDKLD